MSDWNKTIQSDEFKALSRTLAPEGEACPTCNGVRPEFCSNAFHLASPVVPAPEGEAVAWRLRRVGVVRWNLWDLDPRVDTPAYADAAEWEVQPLYASPVVLVGREEIAAMAWRFRGNDRLGNPFYEGAKPTDSPAMADCFAFADAILAALTGEDK